MRRHLLAAAIVLGAFATGASAQEVTLKVHHFLPPQANIPAKFIEPWARKVEADSSGRINVEIYPAMQLGGKPPALIDQVRDGVVDIVWTLPGYTPGRFPKAEVFELPFMPTSGEATSRAAQEYFDRNLAADEFKDFKIIAMHVHGPGLIHSKEPVERLGDMQGLKVRGPTRMINKLLETLGAVPVGLPVPAVPEALSKGVIQATAIPWEVTTALKVPELVSTHTEFEEPLYTSVFVFAMNKDKYESLPDDLRAVIDRNSGVETAAAAGRVMDEGDAPAREVAIEAGNAINRIEDAELEAWKAAAKPVIEDWVSEMKEDGIDGQALLDDARASIERQSGS